MFIFYVIVCLLAVMVGDAGAGGTGGIGEKFSPNKSPFSQNVRFDNQKHSNAFSFVADAFGNVVSDSFRYYIANPLRKWRNEPEFPSASIRYQRLSPIIYAPPSQGYHSQSQSRGFYNQGFRSQVVTAPTCPVTNDPKPCGGATCTKDLDCNSLNQGGICNLDSTDGSGNPGSCVCANGWGNPDCSYRRTSKDLVGGLQIGLVFCGVGGVGNFILGRTGIAVGQLILMLGYYLCCVSLCLIICQLQVPGIVLIIIGLCAYLAGFIWAIVDGAHMLQCLVTDAAGYALF